MLTALRRWLRRDEQTPAPLPRPRSATAYLVLALDLHTGQVVDARIARSPPLEGCGGRLVFAVEGYACSRPTYEQACAELREGLRCHAHLFAAKGTPLHARLLELVETGR